MTHKYRHFVLQNSRNDLEREAHRQILTLGDDALDTHHAAEQARGQGAGSDVLGAEASFQANVELVVLFGISGVHVSHQVLQRPLKRQQLHEGIVHQSDKWEKKRLN